MKSNRAGYLGKRNQGNKKNQNKTLSAVANTPELQEDKKETSDCNGVCSIHWKPATVASR